MERESKERGSNTTSMRRKKEGCEIEARGISYKIYTPQSTRPHPLKIWDRGGERIVEAKKQEQQSHGVQDLDVEQGGELKEVSRSRHRHVLKNVDCTAKPWEIMAIVGPSGAGKSTLLEILAGKLEPDSSSSSSILVNNKPMDKANFKKTSGYVTQKDSLFPLLTVHETLLFSAKLRLRLPRSQLSSRVESLILELGLGHVVGTRIGDERVRGISGGERRRVSIGVDVIHDPRVLILDEPTSGLDSTSALQIVDMLKAMAETRGRTIILSIHQPGFRIVKLFNSILLLANGSVLHHGTTDQLQAHMTSMGLHIPLHVNVVEFAIESIDTLQQQQRLLQQQIIIKGKTDKFTLQELFQLSKVADEKVVGSRTQFHRGGFANSRLYETLILSHRFSKIIFRTRELFALRTLQMLIAGFVLGSIFYDLKDNLVGAEERVGLFAFILTFLLSCTTEALPIFLQEREILTRETSSGSYRVSSYVIANALVFLPFLLILAVAFTGPLYWLVGLHGNFVAFIYFLLLIWLVLYTANSVVVCFSALVPNFIVGNSLISGVMGSFFLFSGYFISKEEIPNFWIFMHYISLFKYPFEGFLVNEFSCAGKCLERGEGSVCLVTGENLLREEGLGEENRWKNVVIMVGFIFAYRFCSYLVLRCRCSQRCLRRALFERD